MKKAIELRTPYIELGKFLKLINKIETGGLSKSYLLNNDVFVNDVKETRRGRKLYDGDVIVIDSESFIVKTSTAR